jgi:hypothetical protein
MKKIILAGVTVAALGIVAVSPAEARDGCGLHRFRDSNGYCHWLRPPPPVYDYGYDYAPPPPIFFGFGGGWGGGGGWHHGWHH